MRWYLKVNSEELEASKAMETLEEIKAKGWKDYLILPGDSGFNILRGLEDLLGDPDHINRFYEVRNSHGGRPTRPKVSVTGTRAVFNGLMIVWSSDVNISSFYYHNDKELDYIEKFGLKDPILIKCST